MIAAAAMAVVSLGVAAWPARVVVAAPGHTTIHLSNPGAEAVQVEARVAGYGLDLRGRPRVQRPGHWLRVEPLRLRIAPGRDAEIEATVARPREAAPGDHASLLLLTTRPPAGRRVVARLRLGVVIVARVPGPLVRRLALGALRPAGQRGTTAFDVVVANRGNVDEWIGSHRVTVRLLRRGRLVATLAAQPRRLLARSRGLVRLTSSRLLHGPLLAIVSIDRPSDTLPVLRRTLRLRL